MWNLADDKYYDEYAEKLYKNYTPTSQVKMRLNSYEMKSSNKKYNWLEKNAIREIYKTFVKLLFLNKRKMKRKNWNIKQKKILNYF